ncbi:hypothetical protein KF840_18660 [bacterium]|nr:hypothetical protein [bacterium]
MTRTGSLAIAVASSALFAALAGHQLAAPGLYYDEAHQVPAVFAWLGGRPGHFCRAVLGGVPWMTMSYSGAVKSALFALVLEASGWSFTVAAWRWFGVAFVVAGWIWCGSAVGRRWGGVAALVFAALLLTDVTLLLTTRHDWGPTALAFALRCAFIAVWLRNDRPTPAAAVALGAIVGFALYEKLSNVVLLPALAIALAGAPRRQLALAVLGLALGGAPLAIVNAVTWWQGEGPISLSDLTDPTARPWWQILGHYLSLGQGDWVRRWVLDLPAPRPLIGSEALLTLVAIGVGCARRASRRFMLAYVAILVVLLLLPRRTGAHHWIAGTPFQYVALAVLAAGPARRWGAARMLVALLVLLRLPTLVTTMTAIADHRTAPRFDPAQTRAAQWLAAQPDAMVVAATWGIGNQIVAFANGRRDAFYEPIYDDREVDAFLDALAHSDRTTLYVATVPSMTPLFAPRTARILAAIAGDGRWREAPLEPPPANPAIVMVRKLVRGDP